MKMRSMLLGVLIAAACKGSSSTGTGGSPYAGTYTGPIAGLTTSGVLTLTVGAAATAPAPTSLLLDVQGTEAVVSLSGTLKIKGDSSYTVSGSFDNSTGQIVAPPGVTAGPYTITGGFTAGAFTGKWKSATDSGTWTLPAVTTGGAVRVLCGVYTGDATGVWNLAVSGAVLKGVAGSSAGTLALAGSIATSGSSPYSLTLAATNDPLVTASGQLFSPPDSAHGHWADAGSSDTGSWSGSVAACN